MKTSIRNPNLNTPEYPTSAETKPDSLHVDVELLAYELWLQRGSPDGAPEQDWFAAEQILKTRTAGAS